MTLDRRQSLSLLGAGGLAAATFSTGCRGDAAHRLIGLDLPSLALPVIGGTPLDLSRLNQRAVVRFWGLWCPACVQDEPHWQAAVRRLKQIEGLAIYTVHVGQPPSNGLSLPEWIAAQPRDVDLPLLDDGQRTLSMAIGLPGTPSIVMLDAAGQIREHAWALKHARGTRALVERVQHFMR
jgi:thiol-disulfide isomerase/thioredoxin